MKEEHIEVEGRVQTVLPGTMFRVELDNKHLVLATICGKMRKRWVRLTVGDRVKMEMSPYDLDKARIVWRRRVITGGSGIVTHGTSILSMNVKRSRR